ncbi:MAG TPA: ABC transporter permease [Rubrobacteraceae bacterium]|nr:ABC transporter permease [Rubrobacteraceae bacterium]
MRLFRNAAMGCSALAANPFRTALAALGIVIGVASVVTLTSLGNGVSNSVSAQITDLGPNLITVSPGGSSEGGGPEGGPLGGAVSTSTLTPQDTETVAELPSVRAASSNVSTGGLVEGQSVQLSGVDPSYENIRTVDLASGRFIEGNGEVVLSASDARDFLDASPEGAIGQTITIGSSVDEGAGTGVVDPGGSANADQAQPNPGAAPRNPPENLAEGVSREAAQNGVPQNGAAQSAARGERGSNRGGAADAGEEYEVVGVAAGSQQAGIGPAQPATSYISTQDALELSGSETVGQILASATSADSVDEARAGIISEIREAHGGQRDFTVVTQEELLSTLTQTTAQLNIFLAGIAGISLLVGGIGIMNIMLVSVVERTREIGIRKAVGATDADVLWQFLFEAVLLSVLGGAVGVGFGVAASTLMPALLADLPSAVYGTTQIALAFGVAALIGVLFGSLPAYRSARLAPVEALRRE